MSPGGQLRERILQRACDRACFTVSDRAEVDFANGDDFGRSSTNEDLVGDVKLIAGNRLLDDLVA